jgi:hypothetical protein
MIEMWFSWAGSPSEMLVDAGTEFNSEEFAEFAQANNIKLTTISPEAQYQNGKAERHGSVLKTMLTKFESDHPITPYQDLSQALYWCIRAKNASSLKKGFAPEVLVLGKQSRIPGSVCSDEMLPAHFLADSETAQGVSFRRQLAYTESARLAFFQADNDASLRRAMLRRARPGGQQYEPGKWVMAWKQSKGTLPGHWMGPMKVVVHENSQTIWTTMACKLYRCAPGHMRPVSANEARTIPIVAQETSISIISQQLDNIQSQGITRSINMPVEIPIEPIPNEDTAPAPGGSESEGQPDVEPEIPSHQSTTSEHNNTDPEGIHQNTPESNLPTQDQSIDPAITTPIPDEGDDDDLMCDTLLCQDVDKDPFDAEAPLAWKCEIPVFERTSKPGREKPLLPRWPS